MSIEVKVPVLPESVEDAVVSTWHKEPGDAVKRDENLVDLETDKVVLEVPVPNDGVLKEIKAESGDTVHSDDVLAIIEEDEGGADDEDEGDGEEGDEDEGDGEEGDEDEGDGEGAEPDQEQQEKDEGDDEKSASGKGGREQDQSRKAKSEETDSETKDDDAGKSKDRGENGKRERESGERLSPAARRVAKEERVDPSQVSGTGRGGRVTKGDVLSYLKSGGSRQEERVKMTRLRTRIAERMKQAQDTAAILTSFNEVDLNAVMDIRRRYKEAFQEQHDVKLGIMSFFIKACCEALRKYPVVNASLDDDEIVYHNYQDIGIAVSTDRGLMVPIIRNAETLGLAEIEKSINHYAQAARDGSITLEDLQGGTFTITNGGVFGSLVSTPLLNPPQSAILGMHAIKERPVVVDGEIVVRPMMYLALSYDHRIIDGRDAVLFLVAVRDALEDPARMLLNL